MAQIGSTQVLILKAVASGVLVWARFTARSWIMIRPFSSFSEVWIEIPDVDDVRVHFTRLAGVKE